jgi:hypothetical protein
MKTGICSICGEPVTRANPCAGGHKIIEFRFDVNEERHKRATQEERQEYLTRLFELSSIATTDYGADVDWSDSFHWIIRVPEQHEESVRQLLGAGK